MVRSTFLDNTPKSKSSSMEELYALGTRNSKFHNFPDLEVSMFFKRALLRCAQSIFIIALLRRCYRSENHFRAFLGHMWCEALSVTPQIQKASTWKSCMPWDPEIQTLTTFMLCLNPCCTRSYGTLFTLLHRFVFLYFRALLYPIKRKVLRTAPLSNSCVRKGPLSITNARLHPYPEFPHQEHI